MEKQETVYLVISRGGQAGRIRGSSVKKEADESINPVSFLKLKKGDKMFWDVIPEGAENIVIWTEAEGFPVIINLNEIPFMRPGGSGAKIISYSKKTGVMNSYHYAIGLKKHLKGIKK